jgi:hypothetical protein
MTIGTRFLRLVTATWLVTAAAAGQTRATRPLTEELEGDARSAFEQGKDLFEHGDFRTAHAKFRTAYDQSKNPRILWNLAACSSREKRYARAIAEAERFLAEGGTSLSDEQVGRAVNFVREMRAFVAEVSLTVSPVDARVTIDRELAPTEGGTAKVFLEVGTHDLYAEKEGFEPLRSSLAIEAPTALARTIQLRPVVTAARLVVDAPADARIELDGTLVARGHFEGSVEPGAHRLRVEAEGRESYASMVDLVAGSAKTLSISLGEPQEKRSWWPWVIGGTALAAGAAVGGFFLLRPEASQEPQVPGTLGTVYLK